MQRVRNDFLSGSGFAFDDHRGIGRRDFFEDPIILPHLDVSADDVTKLFLAGGHHGHLFVERLKNELRIAKPQQTSRRKIGFLDADLVDPRPVRRFEIPNDVGVIFLNDLGVLTADGVVFDDEVVFVKRSNGDEPVFKYPFAAILLLLSDDAAFAQVKRRRFAVEIRKFGR